MPMSYQQNIDAKPEKKLFTIVKLMFKSKKIDHNVEYFIKIGKTVQLNVIIALFIKLKFGLASMVC